MQRLSSCALALALAACGSAATDALAPDSGASPDAAVDAAAVDAGAVEDAGSEPDAAALATSPTDSGSSQVTSDADAFPASEASAEASSPPVCTSQPKAAACGSLSCGEVSDGCEGKYGCGQFDGGCSTYFSCNAGVCTCTNPLTAKQACGSRTCGWASDGCGGQTPCNAYDGTCPVGATWRSMCQEPAGTCIECKPNTVFAAQCSFDTDGSAPNAWDCSPGFPFPLPPGCSYGPTWTSTMCCGTAF